LSDVVAKVRELVAGEAVRDRKQDVIVKLRGALWKEGRRCRWEESRRKEKETHRLERTEFRSGETDEEGRPD
jgi:hypothetical protein